VSFESVRKTTPHFGLPTLIFLVVANMLGAGVFTTSGFALSDLGSASRVLLAWCLGGGIALCGAISYGLLARKVSESGGEYIFLRKNLHPAAGFVGGLLSILVGFSGATAYAAMTLEVYFGATLQGLQGGVLASLVVLIGWLLHALHIQAGSRTQNGLVALKLVALSVFIVMAFSNPSIAAEGISVPEKPFSWFALATTLMWISFSYSGFNAAVYVSEEADNPRVNVPRALVLGTLITTAFYIFLNAAFVCIPPASAVRGHADVALKAAVAIGGENLLLGLRVIIVVALFTSVSSLFMAGPRVCVKMAEDGVLPRIFYTAKRAPLMAATLQVVLVLTIIWLAQLRELLSYLGMTLSLSTLLTVSTIFKLYKIEDAKSFLRLLAPMTFMLLTTFSLVLAGIHNPQEALASVGTLALCFVLYFVVPGARATFDVKRLDES